MASADPAVTVGRHVGVIGGGVLGLAIAHRLAAGGTAVTVLEKEPGLARHQTGRNSGVAHAGVYYAPGSLKATLCRRGVTELARFCRAHDVRYVECGKVIVATDDREVGRLDALLERAVANGVPGARLIDADEITRLEPHVRGRAALHSPSTAIVDFVGFVDALRGLLLDAGGTVLTGHEVAGIDERPDGVHVRCTDGATHRFDALIACAGLHADQVARMTDGPPSPRIVPFRGEYFEIVPARRSLVRGLVYPVPDPALPFLGIHFTATVDGGVLVGPNAVLALAREGYRWRDVDARELWDTVRWPGFRRLARAQWRTGATEVYRSLNRYAFAAEGRRFIPELRLGDLRRARAGVRAQAVADDGTLLDDFRLDITARVVHVRNAPSPAATASLAIADHVLAAMDGAVPATP